MSRTIFSFPFLTCPPSNPNAPSYPPDELGAIVRNANNYELGEEIINTSLAGTWHGNSNSLLVNPPATPGDKCSGRTIIEAGNGQMWFFLQPNGAFEAYADGSRDGTRLIRGGKFTGRLFHQTDYHYAMVLFADSGGPDTWSTSYYPAMLSRDRQSATIFLLGLAGGFPIECRDYGVLFKEQQWFNKISDEVDYELMRKVRRYSDQWLWQPAPENGAPGEQYPPTCPDPTPSENPCWGGDELPELP